jgi:hypothetical protein
LQQSEKLTFLSQKARAFAAASPIKTRAGNRKPNNPKGNKKYTAFHAVTEKICIMWNSKHQLLKCLKIIKLIICERYIYA